MKKYNENRFMVIETWLLKLYAIIAFIGIVTITIMFVFDTLIETIASAFSWFFVVSLYLLIAMFFVSVIQILRYLISTLKRNDRSIKNSLIVFLTSPISIFIYWLISFVLLLSMASCS